MKDAWRRRVKTRDKPVLEKLKRLRERITSMREGGRNAVKTTVLFASFVALAIWLERATDEAVKQLTSIPYHYWWWGLGTTGGVVLLVWLIKKAVRREAPTTGIYRRFRFSRPAVVIPLILVGIYGPITYFALRSNNEERGRPPARSASLLQLPVPAEVALPIIAGCESGDRTPGSGRQFEADGKTPLRNREGSSAIGKYQIMASRHEARARSLGFDIQTEEGNEGYARYLYAESGTFHWEADPRSRACWEPLLARARGALPSTATSTPSTVGATFVVTARAGQPVESVMPPGWMIVWWGDKSRFTSDFFWRDRDKVRVFSVRPGVRSAEIKILRYHDPDPNGWRRQ